MSTFKSDGSVLKRRAQAKRGPLNHPANCYLRSWHAASHPEHVYSPTRSDIIKLCRATNRAVRRRKRWARNKYYLWESSRPNQNRTSQRCIGIQGVPPCSAPLPHTQLRLRRAAKAEDGTWKHMEACGLANSLCSEGEGFACNVAVIQESAPLLQNLHDACEVRGKDMPNADAQTMMTQHDRPSLV